MCAEHVSFLPPLPSASQKENWRRNSELQWFLRSRCSLPNAQLTSVLNLHCHQSLELRHQPSSCQSRAVRRQVNPVSPRRHIVRTFYRSSTRCRIAPPHGAGMYACTRCRFVLDNRLTVE